MKNKEKYCPNALLFNDNFGIGELKTKEDVNDFPLKYFWNLDETFKEYKAQNKKVFILCDWNKSIQDSTKFVLMLLSEDGEQTCYDMNNLKTECIIKGN